MSTRISKLFLLSCILIILYAFLIIPYSILASVDNRANSESGVVVSIQSISYNSLPKTIQDILKLKSNYDLIILDYIISPDRAAVLYQGDLHSPGDFVIVERITTNLYVDSHDLSFVEEPFNNLVVGKVNNIQYGGDIIGFLAVNKLSFLFLLSKFVFYTGGFLIIIILSLLYSGKLEIWNIPGVLCCYSLEIFIVNIFSMLNQPDLIATRLDPDFTEKFKTIFGYLFILFIYLTIITKKYESTDRAERLLNKLFQYHKEKLKSIRSIFNL